MTHKGKRRLAVIGDPIAHTLSPVLHSFLIDHFQLPFSYEAIRVRAAELPDLVARIRRGEFAGVNVTIPHKQSIMPLLDDIESPANRIGAVNTVVPFHGLLIGHNTDASGLLRSLHAAGISVEGEEVLVLGAGGAAAAVVFALIEASAGLTYICNRKLERAQRLASTVPAFARERIRTIPWQERIEWLQMRPVTVIVNATSVGMHPAVDESPVPASVLHSELVVIDLIYNPFETRLLREAKQAGAITLHGLPMLIFQGVAALKLWTGQELDIGEIYPGLESRLIGELSGV